MTSVPVASPNLNLLFINTPEGVRFSLPLAGPITRFLAWLIDALVIQAAFLAILRLLNSLPSAAADLTFAIGVLCYFALNIGYAIILEWSWRGQTIGKRVLHLRVIDASGMRLQFSQIALRNLLRAVDSLPLYYLIGGVALILSRHSQRLGDMVANTVVVRQRHRVLPNLVRASLHEKFNSFLAYPNLAARLRQQTPPALAQIAMEAAMRRDELLPATRIEVFRRLAAAFGQVVTFPEDITATMADERYVRNALQVILNTGNLRQGLPK